MSNRIEVDKNMLLNNQWLDLDDELVFNGVFDELDELDGRFDFHQLDDGQKELCQAIRHIAKDMAVCIRDLCPEGREKSLAMTKLEESVMWANAAIARL